MGSVDAVRREQVWKRRFEEVIDLCTSLYWQEDRSGFFRVIARHLHDMAEADNVNIRLLSSTRDSFVLYATYGSADPSLLSEYNVLSASTGRMPKLMETLKPIVFDFANPQQDDIEWERGSADGFRTAITIPLVSGTFVEGVCDLLYCDRPDCGEETLEWLARIGRLVGIIISNSILTEAQIDMRLMDERKRLSSEIHDNLSQVISVVSFEAGNMRQSLEEGDEELLANQLARLSKASDIAVKMLRSEMTQLYNDESRTMLSIADIRSYLETFSSQWGLDLSLELSCQHEDINISGRVGSQLIRMLNEAMTNIVRHAKAAHVRVLIAEANDSLSLTVSDDGCGFDTEAVGSDRMGIRTMRERARSVDGDVLVTSAPSCGTSVSLFLPHVI